MLLIKILGSGCANCQRLERETRAALAEANISYELTKVTDYAEILAYSVLSTPALVINETVLTSGRIPSRAKIIELAQAIESSGQ